MPIAKLTADSLRGFMMGTRNVRKSIEFRSYSKVQTTGAFIEDYWAFWVKLKVIEGN
jgi:hypothetical protein